MNGVLTTRSLLLVGAWIAVGAVIVLLASALACTPPPGQAASNQSGLEHANTWEPLARVEIQGWAVRGASIVAASTVGSVVEIDPATGSITRSSVVAKSDAIPAQLGIEAIPAHPILEVTPAIAVAPDGSVTLAGGMDEGSPDSTLLLSTDGGRTWDRSGESPTGILAAAVFTPESGIIVGPLGAILRSRDQGRSWEEVRRSTDLDIFAVAALPSGIVLAVGDQGLVLRSTDHGMTWSGRSFGRQPLYAVAFADDGRTVVATGRAGTALRSPDGGSTFAPVGLEDSATATRLPAFASVALDSSTRGVLITCGTDDGRVFSRATNGIWTEVRLDEGAIMHLARTRAGLLAASTTGTVYIARARQ